MEISKKTDLYHRHNELGGKIIDFAGYLLPVQYEGIIKEHEVVRNAAGLFDVSHMGEVNVKGEEAIGFVQNLITNDIAMLKENEIVYTTMCYEDGGVVDDLLVYKINNNFFYLVINASNTEKDYAWMVKNSNNFNVELENISESVSQVALQGPKAQEILQKLTVIDLNDIKFYNFKLDVSVNGMECLVSRTGYTGEDGFEIYCKNKDVVAIWDAILKAGAEFGIKPAGLGCRDTLRFEAALPLYGNELSKDVTPLEAGLGFCVKLDKQNFVGKDALANQKAEGLKRKTIGFEMIDRGIPRHGYEVMADGKLIGFVTTGYAAPTVNKNIGLALIDADYSKLDTEINIVIRNKEVKAKVISKKFLNKNYKK